MNRARKIKSLMDAHGLCYHTATGQLMVDTANGNPDKYWSPIEKAAVRSAFVQMYGDI